MVKVSVVIPTYNAEAYIEKCLDSLVNQTLKDIEIIVVSDGSVDNTNNILKKYSRKYNNIKAYYNSSSGVASTRNYGIKRATGKYLSFVDSDDFVEDDFLEKMYNFCEKEKLDIAVCDYYKYYESGDVILEKLPSFSIGNVNNNPNLIYQINSAPWNKLFKRVLFENLEFPNIKYEDFAIMTYLLFKAKKIGKLDDSFNYYLIRNASETGVVDKRCYDILTILKRYNEFFKENGFCDKNYLEVEYFNIEKLVKYIIQQRMQKDKDVAGLFIHDCYKYLDTNFPNWRKNKYYKEHKISKRFIETNKWCSIAYIKLYMLLKGNNNEKTR